MPFQWLSRSSGRTQRNADGIASSDNNDREHSRRRRSILPHLPLSPRLHRSRDHSQDAQDVPEPVESPTQDSAVPNLVDRGQGGRFPGASEDRTLPWPSISVRTREQIHAEYEDNENADAGLYGELLLRQTPIPSFDSRPVPMQESAASRVSPWITNDLRFPALRTSGRTFDGLPGETVDLRPATTYLETEQRIGPRTERHRRGEPGNTDRFHRQNLDVPSPEQGRPGVDTTLYTVPQRGNQGPEPFGFSRSNRPRDELDRHHPRDHNSHSEREQHQQNATIGQAGRAVQSRRHARGNHGTRVHEQARNRPNVRGMDADSRVQPNSSSTRSLSDGPYDPYEYTFRSVAQLRAQQAMLDSFANPLSLDRVTQKTADNLDVREITEEYVNEHGEGECSICMEEKSLGEQVTVLDCEHMFHKHCIHKWLVSRHGHCPECREQVRQVTRPEPRDFGHRGRRNL